MFFPCSFFNTFYHIISIFKLLYISLLQTRQLEENEIVILEENIEHLSILWQKHVSQSITTKFDALVMQVPEIVRNMNGFTGALTEGLRGCIML